MYSQLFTSGVFFTLHPMISLKWFYLQNCLYFGVIWLHLVICHYPSWRYSYLVNFESMMMMKDSWLLFLVQKFEVLSLLEIVRVFLLALIYFLYPSTFSGIYRTTFLNSHSWFRNSIRFSVWNNTSIWAYLKYFFLYRCSWVQWRISVRRPRGKRGQDQINDCYRRGMEAITCQKIYGTQP